MIERIERRYKVRKREIQKIEKNRKRWTERER